MSDAIVLLSGGIDSATALAMTRATGRRCHALSFRYGQRHAVELAAAARVAAALGAASHEIIDLDLRAIGGSALTADIAVPKGRNEAEIGSGIPVTYVPARNTIFLAYAIALAEVRDASEIVVGVNVLDSSGYPDCRPEWLAAMQEVARLGTKAGVERRPVTIRAPLIKMSKAEIIRRGREAGHRLRADALVLRPGAVGRRVRRLRRLSAAAPRLRGRRASRTRPATRLRRRYAPASGQSARESRGRRRRRCRGRSGGTGDDAGCAPQRRARRGRSAAQERAGGGGPSRPGRCRPPPRTAATVAAATTLIAIAIAIAVAVTVRLRRRPTFASVAGQISSASASSSASLTGGVPSAMIGRPARLASAASACETISARRSASSRNSRDVRPLASGVRSSRAGCSAARAGSAARSRCRGATAAAGRAPA